MQGIIIKAISGFYYVKADSAIYECKARGSFRKSEVSPVVGDKVEISVSGDKGVIEKIFERKNLLSRPLIANLDKLFIVSSYSVPAPDTLMIDRLTAVCEFKNIVPVIVFNKSDTGSFEDLLEIYRTTGYRTYTVSALTGDGIDSICKEIASSVCAFAGNSGVGKSSILNAAFADLNLKTGEVSKKLGRGRHTTRHTELFPIGGGYVADTPGFSSFEGEANSFEFKKNLPGCFPEFLMYSHSCRFSSCTHTCEEGCAVIDAVNNGFIDKSRHKSYVTLYNELKDLREWNSSNKKNNFSR